MPTAQKHPRHEAPSPYGTPPPRGATDTYHHGHLRAACVEAGVRLVEDDGPDAVTIRGVARIAGVSHTAPLHHFRDRHELLDAVADRGFDLLVERLDASLAPDATPTEALRAYGRAYVDHAVTHRGLFALMFRPTGEMQGEASYRRLIDLCAAGQAAGELPHGLVIFPAQATSFTDRFVPMDTTNRFHTFRLVIRGTDMEMWVDGVQKIVGQNAFWKKADSPEPFIQFGSSARSKRTS